MPRSCSFHSAAKFPVELVCGLITPENVIKKNTHFYFSSRTAVERRHAITCLINKCPPACLALCLVPLIHTLTAKTEEEQSQRVQPTPGNLGDTLVPFVTPQKAAIQN